MSGDRLTRLPNTVLRRVLSHAPAKEAVSTGALARAWRSLWLSSGVLNLDSRSYDADRLWDSRSLVFIRDANAALLAAAAAAAAAGDSSLRKLTFTYLPPGNGERDEDMYYSQRHINDGLDALLTGAPAATRGLEELRVHVSPRECYSLRVASLPSDALRALHLDGLTLTSPLHYSPLPVPVPAAPFAMLETLRLRRCTMRLTDLQAVVDSAPLLAALELDRVHITPGYELASSRDGTGGRLRWCGRDDGVELHAPSLRRFAYSGSLQPFALVLPSPASMARADLHFDLDFFSGDATSNRRKDEACRLFWHFVGSFGGVEVLNVSFQQPGARRRARQFKKLDLPFTEDAYFSDDDDSD